MWLNKSYNFDINSTNNLYKFYNSLIIKLKPMVFQAGRRPGPRKERDPGLAREKCAAEPGRGPGPRKVRCRAQPPARPAVPSPAAGPACEKCAAEPGHRPSSRKVRCRARPPARPAKSALPSPAASPPAKSALPSSAASLACEKCAAEPGRLPGPRKVR